MSGAAIYGFQLDTQDEDLGGPKILRSSVGHLEKERIREIALQDAARGIKGLAPAIRLVREDKLFGGTFFVMDRLPGGTLWRWYWMPVVFSILCAFLVSQPLPILFVGYLAGVSAVGIGMATQKLLLQAVDVVDVRAMLDDYGVEMAEASSTYWLGLIEAATTEDGLSKYRPGYDWLRGNVIQSSDSGLCLGDFHPANCMATWTGTVGLIDWEMACIADPELDLAGLRYLVTLVGPLALPIYWVFRLRLKLSFEYDERKVRFFEAQRILFMLCSLTNSWRDHGATTPVSPLRRKSLLWILKVVVWTHTRRFRKLTGVNLS